MTGKEVRAMKDDELKLELSKLRVSLFDMRTKSVSENVADTSKPGQIRKDIARILTETTARARAGNPKVVAKAPAKAAPAKATKKVAAKAGK
jgi:large subunit ribosomal protein L29